MHCARAISVMAAPWIAGFLPEPCAAARAAATCAWPRVCMSHWAPGHAGPDYAKCYCCALPGAFKLLLQAAESDSTHIQRAAPPAWLGRAQASLHCQRVHGSARRCLKSWCGACSGAAVLLRAARLPPVVLHGSMVGRSFGLQLSWQNCVLAPQLPGTHATPSHGRLVLHWAASDSLFFHRISFFGRCIGVWWIGEQSPRSCLVDPMLRASVGTPRVAYATMCKAVIFLFKALSLACRCVKGSLGSWSTSGFATFALANMTC